jgi:ATP-dependent helicase HrpB
MVLAAQAEGAGGLALDLAAILSERDFITFAAGAFDADLRLRLDILHEIRCGKEPVLPMARLDRAAGRRLIRQAEALGRLLGVKPGGGSDTAVGRLLAWAYPDRIGQRRPGAPGRFLLANGRGATFSDIEPLSASEYIVAADLDGERREARIFRAAGYDAGTLVDQYAGRIVARDLVTWEEGRQAVSAERQLRLGSLVLKSDPLPDPDPQAVSAALIQGIRAAGIACLPWTREWRAWQARVLFLRRTGAGGEEWPDLSDPGLADSLEEWLTPYLRGFTRLSDLKKMDLGAALAGRLSWRQRRNLEAFAPTHFTVPSGSRIRLDYSGKSPVLPVRLQEMFGCADTPRIGGGVPVLLHLLSPAGRPVQVTTDLAGFWERGYPEVKKQLKGRYPKHPWPDDPLKALPSRRTRGQVKANPTGRV